LTRNFSACCINNHPNIGVCATVKLQFWGAVQLKSPIQFHNYNSSHKLAGTKNESTDFSSTQHFNDCAVFTKVALLLNPSSVIILTASKPLWNVKSSCGKRLLALTVVFLPNFESIWRSTFE
jgi:hypothetical protein